MSGGVQVLQGWGGSFGIAANGFGDGPAQALRDYLVSRGDRVVTMFHPLTAEQGTRHVITTYAQGTKQRERTVRLPLRPPLSFMLDPLVPLLPARVDAWFGFNPLACARGLAARRQGRARFVALWSVDFVPDRFGSGTLPTRIYDRVDKLCCVHADARIELSGAARDGRNERHGLAPDPARTHIVPMGAWLDRVATTPADGFTERRVAFLGHLVPRQGVDKLLDGLAVLRGRGESFSAEIIGTGPEESKLRARTKDLGLEGIVRFTGFVEDHRDVERLLARSSLAVAPYRPTEDSFTRYADPGKLKAYLAAGLPIVLTDVPPNARELAHEAGAEIVDYDASAIADAVSRGLTVAETWGERRRSALAYAQRFDWNILLRNVLETLGLGTAPG
jgi:glycosyltransferase involved in cell wall biosynthesis